MNIFFYGTLCHLPLLETVLGRRVEVQPAQLGGWRAHWATGRPHPMLVEDAEASVEGILVAGLMTDDLDRLDFYEGGFDHLTRKLSVETANSVETALVYFPSADVWTPGAPWRLADWLEQIGAEMTATAMDVMALYGRKAADDVRKRYDMMLVRGASRVRAQQDRVSTQLRRSARDDDVSVKKFAQPYAKFFAVEEYDLRFRRFDGAMSPTINRGVFVSGDAVTVLPYDPSRDRVLLIEQFRAGSFARGDKNAWSLEAIAGRIDPGETPEDCARREAVEESGLHLGDLEFIAGYYPSPGAKTEFLYSYVALADLPDGVAGVHGVAEEAEDIRGHLVSFERLMDLVAAGEISNGPLLVTALWLQRERPRLRAQTGARS